MVHNGIEYGDMQVVCEAYHLMKHGLRMNNDEIAEVPAHCSTPVVLKLFEPRATFNSEAAFRGRKSLFNRLGTNDA